MYEAYERAQTHSNAKLEELRSALAPIVPADSIAMTFGSYARREASQESDIDYLIVTSDEESMSNLAMAAVRDAVSPIVPLDPSSNGAFGRPIMRAGILQNIGGREESNDSFTHRLLFLLEGEWLTNEIEFKKFRRELIERYVDATRQDHQLALFLLNDIIRYWRTMTVDYMYKTTEGTKKPWAIRNIKLVFSRKLMYASGLFSVASTVDRGRAEKVDLLEKLFDIPVIERMKHICGHAQMSNALQSYDLFLERFESATVRAQLKDIEPGVHSVQVFRELKNEGHHFTRELVSIFEKTFHRTHPIHRAVIF